MSKIRLKLVTPVKTLYDEEVDLVIMRAIDGDLGVMYGHIPLITALGYGILKIYNGGNITSYYAVFGGYAEISSEEVIILSDLAEHPDDIDRERAQEAKLRAERDLENKSESTDMTRAQFALRRALVRLEVSTYGLAQKK